MGHQSGDTPWYIHVIVVEEKLLQKDSKHSQESNAHTAVEEFYTKFAHLLLSV